MPRTLATAVVLAVLTVALAACAAPAASFDPGGPCTADGSAPGAYPDLEALLPQAYRDEPPARLDSGRNCSDEALGTLAGGFEEIRFAGGTWTFGAERAVVLAVFAAPGLDAEALSAFYTEPARTEARTEILGESELSIAGRTALRLDTKRVDRLHTVVVWPAVQPDHVNVVITSDLPEARIQEALKAFGDR